MNTTPHGGLATQTRLSNAKPVEAAPTTRTFTEAARRLDALRDPVRLQILWWLGQSEQSVTDLCRRVGMRQQAVTHHLNIVKLKRLVAYRREGRFNFYHLTDAGREVMAVATTLIR